MQPVLRLTNGSSKVLCPTSECSWDTKLSLLLAAPAMPAASGISAAMANVIGSATTSTLVAAFASTSHVSTPLSWFGSVAKKRRRRILHHNDFGIASIPNTHQTNPSYFLPKLLLRRIKPARDQLPCDESCCGPKDRMIASASETGTDPSPEQAHPHRCVRDFWY